ncbi:MAG: TerB family tellurite resistance protein [Rhodopseudomonas palustris]|nr:MAG: TerB family tellurite resistance protein [Rhodopseudomonas palustris]
MLSRLRQFIEDVIAPAGPRPELTLDDNGYRLAAAALLIHVISLDGEPSAVERRKLQLLLEDRFNLDEDGAQKLIALATRAENDAVDLYQFTSVLMRTVNEEGRLRIIEMMWEVVYADGNVTEFEENVVWRAADLLAVSARDRINLKRRAAFDLQRGTLREPIDDAAN